MQTHGDSPLAKQVSPQWRDRVLHASLQVGDTVWMGSGRPPDSWETPAGFWVSLQVDDAVEAERLFGALPDGGKVTTPLQQTFGSSRFGMLGSLQRAMDGELQRVRAIAGSPVTVTPRGRKDMTRAIMPDRRVDRSAASSGARRL